MNDIAVSLRMTLGGLICVTLSYRIYYVENIVVNMEMCINVLFTCMVDLLKLVVSAQNPRMLESTIAWIAIWYAIG